MTIKNFIQLVEQADIPNMQMLGQLGDGFAYIQYNGMAGVLDQQSNKMILISQKVPDAYQIVTVAGGREMTEYVGADRIGPATRKALDSIIPRQRPRPPAPLPVQETYESNDQVRSIVQRMMEDTRVPQKPRQGPLRPQTGAGKHKDKKKDQKQGKEKHKGKNLDENSIPFAGLGKHKIGQAGQLRSPGPTGYPKGKLVGGAAESRFGRDRDDQFSLGGRMPRTDRIDRDGPNDQDFSNKMKQQTINRLLDKYPNLKPASLKGKSLPELIQMLREAVKKPNATTRHLRDYPVSDKDVAKPVKPEKKKKDEKKAVVEVTGDKKFDAMMGNIKTSTPVPVSGYVAVTYASENNSNKIKGVTYNGKPMPTSIDDPEELTGRIEFTPDRIEQHLIEIGQDNGWDNIDPGHGRGFSELFFDTNANYTSNTQSLLAKNIVNTVNQINNFFNNMNNDLQSIGLPGYKVDVWQEISSSNGQKIGDLNQIKKIAVSKIMQAPNDAGEQIGKVILRELPKWEADDELGYDPEDFAWARKVAKIYITKGERAGLKAQAHTRARMSHVSDMIDQLLGDAGATKLRTIKDLDEQGMEEGSSYETDSMVSHISQIITDIYPQGGDKNTYMKLVARKLPRIVKNDPKLFRRAFGIAYDRFFHIDQDDDDDFDYTDYSMRQGELGNPDRSVGEAHPNSKIYDKCWSGYKKVPGKKRGEAGSCKKMESISEGILASYGLMEKSPPGFKGTVKAMKKHPELTKGKTKDGKEKNPWALAWHMKNKGYKSHKKADGSDKD